jgi:heme O synthase-like polyprenyltransferase
MIIQIMVIIGAWLVGFWILINIRNYRSEGDQGQLTLFFLFSYFYLFLIFNLGFLLLYLIKQIMGV